MVTWTTVKVNTGDLKPYEHNPRQIGKKAFDTLKASLKEDGYHQRILANADMTIIGGHMRLKALSELGITEVEVLIPDRTLSDKEFQRINIRDNLEYGEWDMDALSNFFEPEDLIEWGMDESLFPEYADAAGLEDSAPDEKENQVECPNCGEIFNPAGRQVDKDKNNRGQA